MFAQVKECVEAYAKEHPACVVRTDRVIGFDVTNGLVDGCCYLFFAEDADVPSLVAKAARTAAGKRVFGIEHENLGLLESRGLNRERRTVPAALGRFEDGDTLITLQSALAGPLMKNVAGAELFSETRVERTFESVLDWWHRFQQCHDTPRVELSGELHEREVLGPIERFRRRYRLEPSESEFLVRRYERDRVLEGAELPLMVRHGDFCTANLVLLDSGVGVFDWEFPLGHRLPLFDLFYFFSSLRFPYTGRRGESTHGRSFASIYWEDSYLRSAVRNALRSVARQYDLPRETLGDLLALSTIHVANMKYDGLLEAHGVEEDDDATERAREARWDRFGRPERDEPLARIRDGVFEPLRLLVTRGLPEL